MKSLTGSKVPRRAGGPIRLGLAALAATILFHAGPIAAAEPSGPPPKKALSGETRRLFEDRCGVCHDLALARNQRLSREVWDEVIDDMINKYQARWITAEEKALIAGYLAVYHGRKPAPGPQPDLPPEAPLAGAAALRRLLEANACTACHAPDRQVVGPAFSSIRDRYGNDPEAPARLMRKIRMGGAGNWGKVPMPPNVRLSDDELRALVNWILGRN